MQKAPVPNKWTEGTGELIQAALTEAGPSQLELANKIYRRQTTLSDMETGKIEVDTSTRAMLADVLRKPISCFFPWQMHQELEKEDLGPLEQEALLHFREIRREILLKLPIQLVGTHRNYDPKDSVIELAPYVQERIKREAALVELHERRRKKGPKR